MVQNQLPADRAFGRTCSKTQFRVPKSGLQSSQNLSKTRISAKITLISPQTPLDPVIMNHEAARLSALPQTCVGQPRHKTCGRTLSLDAAADVGLGESRFRGQVRLWSSVRGVSASGAPGARCGRRDRAEYECLALYLVVRGGSARSAASYDGGLIFLANPHGILASIRERHAAIPKSHSALSKTKIRAIYSSL